MHILQQNTLTFFDKEAHNQMDMEYHWQINYNWIYITASRMCTKTIAVMHYL